MEKVPGEAVFAGSVNERGSLEFRVTAGFGNTTLARIIRSVQAAQAERAPTQRFIDAFAHYYTPAVVAFAVLTAAVPPLAFGEDFRRFDDWVTDPEVTRDRALSFVQDPARIGSRPPPAPPASRGSSSWTASSSRARRWFPRK